MNPGFPLHSVRRTEQSQVRRNPFAPLLQARYAFCALLCITLIGASLTARAANGDGAETLRAHYAAVGDRLINNPFKRPLTLDSSEASDQLSGDIHALVDYSYATVQTALNSPSRWCDVLILHLNTKSCRIVTGKATPELMVHIGRKHYQELSQANQVNFAYRISASRPDYLEVMLSAAKGPFGTSDYRIVFKAIPVDGGKTYLHLQYSYRFGMSARLAMQAYLATLGSGKSGFTVTGKQANGTPVYVSGMRGALERNTMRYYLAIDAYLGALAAPPAQQVEQRLNIWFNSTERYFQLSEVDRASYLEMKRREIQRQQAALPPAS